jgi:hypothetical protein
MFINAFNGKFTTNELAKKGGYWGNGMLFALGLVGNFQKT